MNIDATQDAMPMYQLTGQLASLEPPPPDVQQLLSALTGNQSEADRYIGTLAGTGSIQEFYSRENVDRILAAAERHGAPPS